ncbi:hypothetical protein GE061_005816 [Apolygus lucorum]|uniref:Uncharacterized protein n=1 Tax=Apolygus lucorum TaxID=248454 RepID=A0A8S9WZ27_APOLU|nr:hypothetical protein GE061_005816 [Apolygus lucorum]
MTVKREIRKFVVFGSDMAFSLCDLCRDSEIRQGVVSDVSCSIAVFIPDAHLQRFTVFRTPLIVPACQYTYSHQSGSPLSCGLSSSLNTH